MHLKHRAYKSMTASYPTLKYRKRFCSRSVHAEGSPSQTKISDINTLNSSTMERSSVPPYNLQEQKGLVTYTPVIKPIKSKAITGGKGGLMPTDTADGQIRHPSYHTYANEISFRLNPQEDVVVIPQPLVQTGDRPYTHLELPMHVPRGRKPCSKLSVVGVINNNIDILQRHVLAIGNCTGCKQGMISTQHNPKDSNRRSIHVTRFRWRTMMDQLIYYESKRVIFCNVNQLLARKILLHSTTYA